MVAGGGFPCGDDGVVDGGVAAEGVFDLGGFDADAADLDLTVRASQENEGTVGASDAPVARAVQPYAGHFGMRQEGRRGLAGVAEVAAGQAHAGQIQLAGDPVRDGVEALVQQQHLVVGDGTAQRDVPFVVVGGAGVAGGVDGDFGGAPLVVEVGGGVGESVVEFGDEVGAEGFAAGDDVAEVGEGLSGGGDFVEEEAEHGGDEVEGGDVVVVAPVGDGAGVAVEAGGA